jgi:long-subunit fatty acid transport protein
MRKILAILSAGMIIPVAAYAQEVPAESGADVVLTNPVAMEFAARPTDPVTFALGGTSAFHSAAARVQEEMKMDASVIATPWSTKTSKEFDLGADIFFKAGKHFGAGVNFGMGLGEKYNPGIAGKNSFQPMDMAVGASVAYGIIPAVGIGASVRYLYSKTTPQHHFGTVGADILLSGGVKGFRYAAGVTNIGGKVKAADGTKYAIPAAGTVAVGYDHAFSKHGIGASFQGDYFFKGGFRCGVGAQYNYNEMVYVRAGYSYGGKTVLPSYASLGAGFHFKGFHLDVAALIGDITGTVMIGAGYRF